MATPRQEQALEAISYHNALGMMMWLMKHADYHSQWSLWNVESEILPPLINGQVKIYFDNDCNPVGFVTWAWLNEQCEAKKKNDDETLSIEEWKSGDRLFFNDFVSPWGHARQIFNDLKDNVFSGTNSAGSIRRRKDGSVRVVNAWKRNQYHKI